MGGRWEAEGEEDGKLGGGMTESSGEEGGGGDCMHIRYTTYGCIHVHSYTQISILQMEEPKGEYCFV